MVKSNTDVHSRPEKYHHGQLRQALMEAGLATLSEAGIGALTLRHVGARVGVSRTALYRHFADKNALLVAIAEDGFAQVKTKFEAARKEGQLTFKKMAHIFIDFALANPAQYRLMFDEEIPYGNAVGGILDAGQESFEKLVEDFAHGQEEGIIREGNPVVLAKVFWATLHGLADLAIDGKLGFDDNLQHCHCDDVLLATVIDTTIDVLIDGLSQRK